MYVIDVSNVNQALPNGRALLRTNGAARPSRYGDVVELDEPVTTHYRRPLERVLFSATRDANPFFHLFEALWILAGRNDVAFLAQFAQRMREFSDNGITFHAAYGHRLRHWDEDGAAGPLNHGDQLAEAIHMLKTDSGSRRVVCSIWSPTLDLNYDSTDIPCNDMIKFEARSGTLNMVVFNRSNDMIWGTYGANAVQFSFIQEYVAGMAGLPVGWYEQVSCNFHAYTATLEKAGDWDDVEDCYGRMCQPYPLVADPPSFDQELGQWFEEAADYPHKRFHTAWNNAFFQDVAIPMYRAWMAHKAKNYGEAGALAELTKCKAQDWRLAGSQWLQRRAAAARVPKVVIP